MQCPFDDTTLQVVNRLGVEIDWCPSCKGVWLERGELDKILDRAERDDDDDDDDDRRPRSSEPARSPEPRSEPSYEPPYEPPYRPREEREPRRYDDRAYPPKKKKRGGFLSDLFEFD